MRLLRLCSTFALLASLCISVGCGDDDPPPPPPPGDAGTDVDDGNDEDTGTGEDTGTDADSDTEEDTGSDADTGMDEETDGDTDGGETMLMGVNCTVDLMETLAVDTGNGREIAIAASGSGWGVTWHDRNAATDNIRYRYVENTAPLDDVVIMLTDDFADTQSPDIVRIADETFLVTWYSNASSNYEIYTRVLASSGLFMGEGITQITNNSEVEPRGLRDDLPRALAIPGGALLSWFEDDSEGVRLLMTQKVDSAGEGIGSAVAISAPGDPVTIPDLIPMEDGYGAVFVDEAAADRSNVIVRLLDSDGVAVGEDQQISTEGNATTGISTLAVGDVRAVAFSVQIDGRAEVRFRTFDGAGEPIDPEQVVTPAPAIGSGPALAALAGGWVVAYRGEAMSGGEPGIQLAFLDNPGELVATTTLAESTFAGGNVTMASNSEGRLLVGWTDQEGGEAKLRIARVGCLLDDE